LKFDNKVTFTEFAEQGSRTVTYTPGQTAMLDVGAGVEIANGIFVAGAFSRFSGSASAEIEE
jgi:hypothetical protein